MERRVRLRKLLMQLKLLLPFLLIGFKCIGEASTELYLARIFDFVKFIISLQKGHEKSELVADGITHLASITRACLSATAMFTKDCVNAIHQLENKSSHLRKILYLKLVFSVEQVFSLASLAFVFEDPGDSQESNPVLFRVLHHSIQCIQAMLADSDIQIQAVGLQVLKVILQKGIGAASNTFLIFFVGELIGDLLIIIRNVSEKHVKREAVAIAGECLKILTHLHTLSKRCDHQKGVINLLLEAILTVFSISAGSLSQEVHDLRSISTKIVSQLAQIPSSAVSVKEIPLAMSATQRQQLQCCNPSIISSCGFEKGYVY